MGYMTDGLTFNTLRGGNTARLPEFKDQHGKPAHTKADGSDWSDAEWLEAVLGELGEYANLKKKQRRGDLDHLPAEQQKRLLADELADVVIYIDLLSFRLGINLGRLHRRRRQGDSHNIHWLLSPAHGVDRGPREPYTIERPVNHE